MMPYFTNMGFSVIGNSKAIPRDIWALTPACVLDQYDLILLLESETVSWPTTTTMPRFKFNRIEGRQGKARRVMWEVG